jgi:hypothetical protein
MTATPPSGHWSAEPHASPSPDDDGDDDGVRGDVIRFMWDYGVSVPLWEDDGLLPDDPEWLRRELGLSDGLIRDLTDWGSAMQALDAHPSRRTKRAYDELDHQARALVEELQAELGSRLTVTYQPW